MSREIGPGEDEYPRLTPLSVIFGGTVNVTVWRYVKAWNRTTPPPALPQAVNAACIATGSRAAAAQFLDRLLR